MDPAYPINTGGFLPNSVMLKILYPPPKPKEDEREKKPYKPPVLTFAQLAEIDALHTVSNTI